MTQPYILHFIYIQPGAEVLHILRSRYAYLKILLIDEISMTGLDAFNHLNKTLQVINQSTLPFGGIYLLAIGDFLQLPSVKKLHIFAEGKKEHTKLCLVHCG